MRLTNKIAVITGAGSGMGKAMAKLFAAEGAQVVCADISGQQNEVAAAIGAAAIAVHADVADEASVRGMIALLQRVLEAEVRVDGVAVASIEQGLLVFVGVRPEDDVAAAQRLLDRILKYRVFADEQGKMNLS